MHRTYSDNTFWSSGLLSMGEGKAQWLEMKNIDSCAQQRGLGQVTLLLRAPVCSSVKQN